MSITLRDFSRPLIVRCPINVGSVGLRTPVHLQCVRTMAVEVGGKAVSVSSRRVNDALLFEVQGRHFGLPISHVLRVIHAVLISRAPGSSRLLPGVIDIHGDVWPVLNLSSLYGEDTPPLKPYDLFVLVTDAYRKAALWVNAVNGIHPCSMEGNVSHARYGGDPLVSTIIKDASGLYFVIDPERLLSQIPEALPPVISTQ